MSDDEDYLSFLQTVQDVRDALEAAYGVDLVEAARAQRAEIARLRDEVETLREKLGALLAAGNALRDETMRLAHTVAANALSSRSGGQRTGRSRKHWASSQFRAKLAQLERGARRAVYVRR